MDRMSLWHQKPLCAFGWRCGSAGAVCSGHKATRGMRKRSIPSPGHRHRRRCRDRLDISQTQFRIDVFVFDTHRRSRPGHAFAQAAQGDVAQHRRQAEARGAQIAGGHRTTTRTHEDADRRGCVSLVLSRPPGHFSREKWRLATRGQLMFVGPPRFRALRSRP